MSCLILNALWRRTTSEIVIARQSRGARQVRLSRPQSIISRCIVVGLREPCAVFPPSRLLRGMHRQNHRCQEWWLRAGQIVGAIGIQHRAVMFDLEEKILDHPARQIDSLVLHESPNNEVTIPAIHLVEDKRIDLARGMVENFFFEIEHYGAVLNANRTYYLTRSQPPFLTSMILAVHGAEKAAGREDRAWLAKAYDYAARDYGLWTGGPHLAGSTGLSRYYDFGSGPAPESVKDETGHYRQVAAFFLSQPDLGRNYLVARKPGAEAAVGPLFALQVCDSSKTMAKAECDSAGSVSLSADYYKGDRAMRESGYDVSFRFRPHSAATHHYAPV